MTFDNLSKLVASPWGYVLGALVLLLLWEGSKKWMPALVEWLAKRLRDVLAGTRLMRGRALRTYRQQVATRYARLPVLFMPDKGLDASKVYVPLEAAEEGQSQPDDAYDQIKATDHVIVLGRPGSGKTMLLRHSMLTWARDPAWRRYQRVPVLLELHRCAANGTTLEEHVVAQFREDGFPNADRFVRRALTEGGLSLLFDGLDEVSSAERGRVVQLLRAFAARYAKCQIVVTCRTAIYDRHLAPEITTSFHVAEFDDRHVRRFLRQWPGMPDETAVERLLAALTDAPRIMQLARNPLLLTMIAYLYGGRSRAQTVMPHSRAEFYHEATDILLDRLKDSRNMFKGAAKKAVLMRLALAAQDAAGVVADRRTLRYEEVLAEVVAIAPKLNIAPADANAVLDEIVDRSGLLLRIDGGSRYQFAHLSLQEYLAAVAHEQDRDGLLAKYQAAPDDWREVVKLWCGAVSADSGPLIEAVFETDEVLAFECLADAQVVDDAVANHISACFEHRLLATEGPIPTAVISAFGLVAADPRPRGQEELAFLTAAVRSGDAHAYAALAATKLPEAAATLVELIHSPAARSALVTMGDLAVPALAEIAESPHVVDLLGAIATPAAAAVLVPMLWVEDGRSYRAAWYLAASLADVDVESALADIAVPDGLTWVWDPFRDDHPVSVARIATQVALLCERSSIEYFPGGIDRVDARLAIPLLVFGFGGRLREIVKEWPESTSDALSSLRQQGHHVKSEPSSDQGQEAGFRGAEMPSPMRRPNRQEALSSAVDEVDEVVVERMRSGCAPDALRQLYGSIDQRLRVSLVARLADVEQLARSSSPVVLRHQDWAEVRSVDSAYRLHRSPLFWLILAIVGMFEIAAVAGCVGLVFTDWRWGPTWLGWVLAVLLAIFTLVICGIVIESDDDLGLVLSFFNMFTAVTVMMLKYVRNSREVNIAVIYGCIMVASTVIVLPLLLGLDYAAWWAASGIVLLVACAALVASRYGRAKIDPDEFIGWHLLGMGSTVATLLPLVVGSHFLGLWVTASSMLVVGCVVVVLIWHGMRRERAARNPLRGLLELDASVARRRTSVIAA